MPATSWAVRDKPLPPGPSDLPRFPFVRALHPFVPLPSGANTCLTFSAGQRIRVLNQDPSGWWDGELDGRRGWFPSNYVEQDFVR
jgi:son of sevenless